MSYDIRLSVKVEGCDKYARIAEPEYCHPTYNLSEMFRQCMDWDYVQSSTDEQGKYQKTYYPCDFVLDRVEHGIRELKTKRRYYDQYKSGDGWDGVDSAVKVLESLRTCIYEQAEYLPLNCVYMSW